MFYCLKRHIPKEINSRIREKYSRDEQKIMRKQIRDLIIRAALCAARINFHRRRAAFYVMYCRTISCTSGWLCGCIHIVQKFTHNTDPALVFQAFFKVVDIVYGRIANPVKLHCQRIARNHLGRYTQQ